MRKAAFVYGAEMSRRDSRADEIFGPTRLQYTFELLSAYGAFDLANSIVVPPDDADVASLESFHTGEYVAAVRSLSDGAKRVSPERFNFSETGDNPVYPGMYDLSTLVVGGSLKAAGLVASGGVDVAFNSAGGQHHAARDHASGFCVFNDVAIAIRSLVDRGLRVAYVDIDAHHGDGVQDAFYGSAEVLFISLHQSGRSLFPGTGEVSEIGTGKGEGYSVNMPLEPHTGDETYLWAFDEIVPALVGRFEPDILVTQLGCDTHYLDRLTQLNLTTRGYGGLVDRMSRMTARWLALGGGGYEASVVVRCWTLAYGLMVGQEWPDEIPECFRDLYGLNRLRDSEAPDIVKSATRRARKSAEESVSAVKRLVFPYHGLS